MKNKILMIMIVLLVHASCEKNKPVTGDLSSVSNAVFILNEGRMSLGNASLSVLDLDSIMMQNNIFELANNAPLGDVGQSIHIRDSLAYIVVNNSGRIYIINQEDYKYHGEISGLTSPREICVYDKNKAYISDLYSPSIQIFNPYDLTIAGSVYLGHSSEKMIISENRLYVLSWSLGNQLFVIDVFTDQVIDSVETGLQPNSMIVDKNQKLWVLCDGGFDGMPGGPQAPRLQCIDPVSLVIEKDFTFPTHEWMTKDLCTNNTGDSLFYINAGIYAMSINDGSLPDIPIIEKENKTFYSLAIQPGSSQIYATDALNYVQPGLLYRYTSQGNLIDSFTVGIVPGDIVFQSE